MSLQIKKEHHLKEKEQKKAKRDSDRARAQTRVNLGRAFTKWGELRDLKGFKTDPRLALFQVDRGYEISLRPGKQRPLNQSGHGLKLNELYLPQMDTND